MPTLKKQHPGSNHKPHPERLRCRHSPARPPIPKSFVSPKTAGIRAILKRLRWLTPSTRAGETGRVREWEARNHALPETQVGERTRYRLIKELWAHDGNRLRCASPTMARDDSGIGSLLGNENWSFDEHG